MTRKLLLASILLPLLAVAAAAQAMQTGALIGTVTAADGTTIPGVSVTIRSPALMMEKMTVVSNENGVFRLPNLAPGSYEVSFELEGFRTLIRRDVRVNVMQTYTMNVRLTQEPIKEAIVVTGKGPTVDTQRQTRAVSMDIEFLKAMPAQRNLGAYVNMAPGLVAAPGQATSAHGGSVMDNSYNLDGVNVTDPTIGLQYVSFGMDIMDEISIQAGGLSAEYGSVRGAMINVVTKSGGNRLSGGGSFYFNHEKLKGDNTQGTPLAGQKSGNKYELEPALSLGGPLVKDKLWFFASLGFNTQSRFVAGFPYDKPVGQEVPIKTTQPYPYVKFTFQPNQKNKFVLSYDFSGRFVDNRGADQFNTVATTYKQSTRTHIFNAGWTRYFGDSVYANFKVGVVRYQMNLDSKTTGAEYYDYYTHRYSGTYWRNQDHNPRPRSNYNADATTFIDNFLGTHELKIGGEAQIARTGWLVKTVPDPVSGATINTMIGNEYYYGMFLYNNGFDRKENLDDYFGFLQDTWRLNRHLTLNLGLRLEYNSITWPKQAESEGPTTWAGMTFNRAITADRKAASWTTMAPRLGMIYDIFGDSKTLIKASWARYTIANQVAWVNLAHPNGWVYNYQFLTPDGVPTGIYLARSAPSSIGIGYGDYKLKAPYTDELTAGFERELFSDWSLSARYIRRWDKQLIHQVDAAQLDIDKLMATGELDWSKNWTPVTVTDPFTSQQATFYRRIRNVLPQKYIVNPPGANRNYNGLEITLNKRLAKGWALNTSYVYGKATGLISQDYVSSALGTSGLFTTPNSHINTEGRLDLESRHQFKAQAMVKGPLGINLSGYFRYLAGLRWTRVISSGMLGLSLPQGATTINAEARGTRHLPDTKLLDMRLEKTFKVGNWSLGLFADCFNIFNQGIATTVWNDSSNTSRPFGQMTAISQPRIFQLGARIEFN